MTTSDQAANPTLIADGSRGSEANHAETLAERLAGTEARLKQAEMLLAVTHQVALYETLDEVLSALVDIASRELDAERGTLFLHDAGSNELYSRIAQGTFHREIRLLDSSGIAGAVFQSGVAEVVANAYTDKRFNNRVDEQTGFHTRNIAACPVKTVRGEVIGVVQCLNKRGGEFTRDDLMLLETITTQAAAALQSSQLVERMQKNSEQEKQFLNVVADVTSELELDTLLAKVMHEATSMLDADRSTLFLNDKKTGELFSRIAMGDSGNIGEIRLPNNAGIAGAVFTNRETINIPYAYADLRFNPAFDKQTGFFTRSILCVPIANKKGDVIGVTQVLNKNGGPFSDEDERRLKAFTGQIAVALESAQLFEDVQAMKNYNDSMLASMSNGVVTFDEDGRIATCNAAAQKILEHSADDLIGEIAADIFSGNNAWISEKIAAQDGSSELIDVELALKSGNRSVNAHFEPLLNHDKDRLGSMLMLEDISQEKRMKSTMSRYMDAGLADQIMGSEEELLGGRNIEATVLFSDIRGFTTLTEQLGAQGTVSLLNEYFTLMVDCITDEGGILDKFIGDAMMAGFGIPVSHGDDEDRALRAGIKMIKSLESWNQERKQRGEMPVDMGLGINTDTLVSGNIGSPKRMDYTMIGDGVNLAARLESACKSYSARILISEFTYQKLQGTYRIRPADHVIVKGKTQPVGIYEVLDYHNETSFPNLMDNVNYFNEGTHHYKAGNWDQAIRHFNEALKANPADGLATIYVERCKKLAAHPPADWSGVWVMNHK